MTMFYTYAHVRKDNGQIFYIGKGSGRRMYRKDARSKHWKNIACKAGFEPMMLASWNSEKEAFEHEKFLINCFKDTGLLVNKSSGGDGNDAAGGLSFSGKKHSQESILKCRQAHLGKPKTPESNAKNSESHKQKIQINGVIYESWESASLKTGIPTGSLSYLLSGKVSPRTKYAWIKSISLVM